MRAPAQYAGATTGQMALVTFPERKVTRPRCGNRAVDFTVSRERYSYDPNGNRKTENTGTYIYQAASNRLVQTSTGTVTLKPIHRLFIAILVSACLSLLGCEFFPESTFELAHESRLPKWFTLPPGLSRSDVTVTMSYYIKPTGHTATFTLKDTKKRKLAEVSGSQMGFEPLTLKNLRPEVSPYYPSYEIITVNGITDIIEHRKMEPIFYVTDDPNVWRELGVEQTKTGGGNPEQK